MILATKPILIIIEMEKVNSIIKANMSIADDNENVLEIYVCGIFISFCYTNPQLLPRQYKVPPTDGIFDFDFVADKSDVQNENCPALVIAEYKWENFPANITGIRIHSKTNCLERNMSQLKKTKTFELL